jgi:hypothetical protein
MPLLAADTEAGTQERLEACHRREAHLPVTDTGREQRVIQKAEDLAKGSLEANRRRKPAIGTTNTTTGTKRAGLSKPGVYYRGCRDG